MHRRPLFMLLLAASLNPVAVDHTSNRFHVQTVSLGRVCSEDVALDARTGRAFIASLDARSDGASCMIDAGRVGMLDPRTGRFTVIPASSYATLALDAAIARVFVPGPRGVSILDAADGHILGTVAVPGNPDDIVADARTGRVFVLGQKILSTLDSRTGHLLRSVSLGISSPALPTVADGVGRVFVSGLDGLAVLDARTGALVRTVAAGLDGGPIVVDERRGRAFIVTNEGAVGNVDVMLRILDARTGAVLHRVTFPRDGSFGAVVVDQGSGHVFVTTDRRVIMLDAGSGTVLRRITVPTAGIVRVDECTARLFVLDSVAGVVRIVDTHSGRLVRAVGIGRGLIEGYMDETKQGLGPDAPVVDEPGDRVFVSNSRDGTVSVLDARDGTAIRTVRLGAGAVGRSFGPVLVDTRRQRVFIATAGSIRPPFQPGDMLVFTGSGHVSILDAHDGGVLHTVTVGVRPVLMASDEQAGRAVVLSDGGRATSAQQRAVYTAPASASILTGF